MKGFVCCRPMPDEVEWSHVARFIWVNGWDRSSELLGKLLSEEPATRSVTSGWLGVLVKSSGLSTTEYLARHTAAALLDLDGFEGANLERMWWIFRPFKGAKIRLGQAMACPGCLEEDNEVHGFAWFRRIHQLRGVDLCLRHNRDLCNVSAPTFAGHIKALNQGKLIALRPAEWGESQYVQAFHARLSELLALDRPIDWNQLRQRVHGVVAANHKRRGPPRGGLIYQWVLADAPPGWLNAHFGFDFIVDRRLNSVFERRLSAIDIALILACQTPD